MRLLISCKTTGMRKIALETKELNQFFRRIKTLKNEEISLKNGMSEPCTNSVGSLLSFFCLKSVNGLTNSPNPL